MKKHFFAILLLIAIVLLALNLLQGKYRGKKSDLDDIVSQSAGTQSTISVSGDVALKEIIEEFDTLLDECPNVERIKENNLIVEKIIGWQKANTDTPANRTKVENAWKEFVKKHLEPTMKDCETKNCLEKAKHLKDYNALIRYWEARKKMDATMREAEDFLQRSL